MRWLSVCDMALVATTPLRSIFERTKNTSSSGPETAGEQLQRTADHAAAERMAAIINIERKFLGSASPRNGVSRE